ncbi:MAG: FAD-dependent oxidoreductase, partial [Chthoniobacterales bacterium]
MGKRKTIAILGGGSAGFTAARIAHAHGARVLFFMGDNADHASLCVNAGCMPSKALFEPIDAMHHAKRHGWLTVEPHQPNEYLAQIVRWKDSEIAEFRAYRQKEIRELANDTFTIIRSNAAFVSEHEVVSEGERHTFDAAIIATGSTTIFPKIDGLERTWDGIWTSDEILHNTRIPKSLAVIGVGAVGLEFSLRYARLGSQVTLLSRSPILSDFPRQFGERLGSIYEREGIRVLLNRQISRITCRDSGEFVIESDGADAGTLVVERILLATGRRPTLDNLGLEKAGVKLNGRGRLEVGDDMRVKSSKHLFAAGDVAGLRMVVHHAH